jgi:pantothenate kinase type III
MVSAGTAMTVDALAADGHFLGGIIVPGIGLMQQALQQGTALVGQTEGLFQTSRTIPPMQFAPARCWPWRVRSA